MKRLLLASFLLLFASTSFAKSPVNAVDPADGSAKPGKAVVSTADVDPNAPAHPAVTPAARSAPMPTRGGAPRWHSLLPGMIR